jgi:ADP-ribose pyrophosphatase YjhB (NUDIX family)
MPELARRIAAGGVIFRDDAVLLVRYGDRKGGSYLAAPGGGLLDHESAPEGAVREVEEETGLKVEPVRLLLVEDLVSPKYKMCKLWFLCVVKAGAVARTTGAVSEGILEAGWFRRIDLDRETVYPPPLLECNWRRFLSDSWRPYCLPSRPMEG